MSAVSVSRSLPISAERVNARTRSLPGWLMDFYLLHNARQLNEESRRLTPSIVERLSEEDLEDLEDSLGRVVDVYNRCLERRRAQWFRLIRLSTLEQEFQRVSDTLYALSRGYAPGHLPSPEERQRFAATSPEPKS